jgi:hypothetical protein
MRAWAPLAPSVISKVGEPLDGIGELCNYGSVDNA